MKYIDAEKLITEIERRKELAIKKSDLRRGRAYYLAMKELLDIIANLPQEQPCEELEKEVYEHLWKGRMGDDLSKPIYLSFDELIAVARHFAQWQKEQDERLIKLAHDSWYKEGFIYGKIEGLSEDEKYQQGRFDMKEQMLKGAIDGFVSERDITENHRLWVYPYSDSLDLSKKGFKYNDDVKIIIVKDDQL